MSHDSKEKAHNEGSEFHREGTSPSGERSVIDQIVETADWAIDEAARLGKTAMEPENRSKVIAGGAVGAVASLAIPFVGPLLGALAGIGYVAHREASKRG